MGGKPKIRLFRAFYFYQPDIGLGLSSSCACARVITIGDSGLSNCPRGTWASCSTMSIPRVTLPKTTCFPSNHDWNRYMKNWYISNYKMCYIIKGTHTVIYATWFDTVFWCHRNIQTLWFNTPHNLCLWLNIVCPDRNNFYVKIVIISPKNLSPVKS